MSFFLFNSVAVSRLTRQIVMKLFIEVGCVTSNKLMIMIRITTCIRKFLKESLSMRNRGNCSNFADTQEVLDELL